MSEVISFPKADHNGWPDTPNLREALMIAAIVLKKWHDITRMVVVEGLTLVDEMPNRPGYYVPSSKTYPDEPVICFRGQAVAASSIVAMAVVLQGELSPLERVIISDADIWSEDGYPARDVRTCAAAVQQLHDLIECVREDHCEQALYRASPSGGA